MAISTKKNLHTEEANKNGRASKMRLKLFYSKNKNEFHTIREGQFASANTKGKDAANEDQLAQLKNRDLDFKTTQWTRLITDLERDLSNQTDVAECKRRFAWKLGSKDVNGSALAPYEPVYENGEGVQYGYWTNYIADKDGNFPNIKENMSDGTVSYDASELKSAIYIKFAKPTFLPGIFINFGNGDGYAERFNIYYTQRVGEDENSSIKLLECVNLSNQPETNKWEYHDNRLADITELWLLPIQWSKPYEPFRISQLSFFETEIVLNDEDLYSVKVIENCEQDGNYESAGLNRLSAVINNKVKQLNSEQVKDLLISPEFTFCDVEMQNGVKGKKQGPEIEEDWVSLGTYYSNNWQFENRGKKITMDATDVLDVISRGRGVEQAQALGKQTFETLVRNLKDNIGVECGLKIKPTLGSRVINESEIKPGDYKTILTEIAVNTGGYLHVDRENNIKIWDYNLNETSKNDFIFNPENVFFNGEVKSYADIGSVNLNAFNGSAEPLEIKIDKKGGQSIDFKELRFIQNDGCLYAAKETFKTKFKDTKEKYEIECRGNPYIEIGDTVILEDENRDQTAGVVTGAEYNYDGALKARYIIKGNGVKNQSNRVFGVKIHLGRSDPFLSVDYTDEAVSMVPGSVEWDDTPLFSRIRPCVFKDGKVNYYLNRNDFRLKEDGTPAVITGADGDVMIEIPKIGIRYERDNDILGIKLTNNTDNPDFNYDAFTRDSAGDRDKLYVGAYLGQIADGKLNSVSGVLPTNCLGISGFRNAACAKNNGDAAGYDLLSWYPLHLLQCLYLIRYKNLNSQAALGCGYTEKFGELLKNGKTDACGMYHGGTAADVMKFMGIENLWGMESVWIDGVKMNTEEITVSPFVNSVYIDILQTAYKNFGNSSSYVTKEEISVSGSQAPAYYLRNVIGSNDAPFIAREPQNGGSGTTYFCDQSKISKNCCCTFGGFSTSNTSAGAFNTCFSYASNTQSTTIGARLMYL